MSETPAATELLRALAAVLGRIGARWYVFGAQAVVVWGRPRLTGDVDVTMFLDAKQSDGLDLQRVRRLIRALEAAIDRSDLLPCLEEQLLAVRAAR